MKLLVDVLHVQHDFQLFALILGDYVPNLLPKESGREIGIILLGSLLCENY